MEEQRIAEREQRKKQRIAEEEREVAERDHQEKMLRLAKVNNLVVVGYFITYSINLLTSKLTLTHYVLPICFLLFDRRKV